MHDLCLSGLEEGVRSIGKKLQIVMSHCVYSKNQTQVFCQSSPGLITAEPFFQPPQI